MGLMAHRLDALHVLLQPDPMFVFSLAIAKRRRPCTMRSGKAIARRRRPAS